MLIDFKKILISFTLVVFFGLVGLFRDIFTLPFFGNRLYLGLIFGFVFLWIVNFFIKGGRFTVSYRDALEHWDLKVFWLMSVLLISVVQFLKSDFDIYLLLQLLIVLISIYLVDFLIKKSLYGIFISQLKAFMIIIFLVMSTIWLLWFLGLEWLLDAKIRNSLPFIFFGGFLLLNQKKESGWMMILAFICLVLICETKGAIILFTAYYFLKIILHKFNSPNLYKVAYISIIIFMTFIPFIIAFIARAYFNISLDDLIQFEGTRYYLPNQVASAISRIYGVVWLMTEKFTEFMPFGVSSLISADEFLFWGYPVHNFFVLLILKYGVVGFFLCAALFVLIYLLMIRNFGLGLTLLFCMVNFNDFYPGFVIFLVPLLTPEGSLVESQIYSNTITQAEKGTI